LLLFILIYLTPQSLMFFGVLACHRLSILWCQSSRSKHFV